MKNNAWRVWNVWFVAVSVVLPVLAGYVVYEQARVPVFDAQMDWISGTVLGVEMESYANWAGFQPGDVILSVNGAPYPEWPSVVGNYPSQILREGQVVDMEIPLVTMASLNMPALLGGEIVALVFWASGLLLLLRRFEQSEIRLLFLLSQTLAIAILFPVSYLPKWSPPAWGLRLSVSCLFLSAPLILHHYLTFPVRLGSPRAREWGLRTLYLLAGIVFLVWKAVPLWGRTVGMAYTFCVVAAAIGALGWSYFRRASSEDRRRLRLIFFASLLGALPALLLYFLPSIFDLSARVPLWLAGLFTVAAPLSYLYAVLRHNLFGIDRLLNRTLVYAALSLGILILYLGPFLLIYRFAPSDWLAQMMAASGLTLLVGLAFERTRTSLQRSVDRLFYGGWYDYPYVVEQATRALAACTDRAQLTDVLARQASTLMHLHGCDLTFDEPMERRPPSATVNAESPMSVSTFLRVRPRPATELANAIRLSFQGQPRALWKVGSHRDGDDLAESDRRILGTLARQAEIALGNVLLIETLRAQLDEIRASREALSRAQHRLLRSREDERARLARDLHDGPLQVLIGLNMQLGLLLPQAAGLEGLAEMRLEIRDLLSELRGVCSELRPPMLDTLGLAAALRSLAEDWSAQSHVETHLDLPSNSTFQSLPGDVSVNLYRVAQEALTNIAKHAQARRVDIQLEAEGDGLSMTLTDDGRGFDLPGEMDALIAEGHFGLVGLRERVNLIGGTFHLQSAPGHGTRLRVDWQPA
jgi:signal transduction histidine kinase